MKYLKFLIPIFFFCLAFFVRTYKIENPVADHHSFRQADTAAVARNFIKSGYNPLFPQSDSLTALSEKQYPNPNRYFLNEFPFYNSIVALVYKLFGVNTVYARYVSIFFASLGTLFLYLFAKKLFGLKVAFLATLVYSLLPYNIYYGRVIMPDPTFVSLSIISLYLLILLSEKPNLIRSILFSSVYALALLTKPYAVFLIFPFLYYILATFKTSVFRHPFLFISAILPFIPLMLWRHHVNAHPEGIFYSTWLLNKYDIRFTGAFFRWLIFDRLNRLIFATGGFVLFVLGLTQTLINKQHGLLLAWLVGNLAYFSVFAAGNVTHDYYQLPIVPLGSILVSLGFFSLLSFAKNIFQKVFQIGLGIVLLILTFAFGWYEVRGFFNVNDWNMIEAGKKIDQITPTDALIIAPYQTNPAFLYNANRYGWTTGYDIDKKISEGADYYVSTTYDDEARKLEKDYTLIEKNDRYIIIKLTPKKQ